MIRHTVLFNTKPAAKQEDIDAMTEAAPRLLGQIPGVRNLAIGATFEVVEPPRYRYGLTMEFDTEEAMRAYLPHPLHQQFRQLLVAVRDDYTIATLREIGG